MTDSNADAFAEANRAYFDEIATKYTAQPWQQKMVAQVAAEIQSKISFILGDMQTDNKELRLLDYACGPGMVTHALAPYITSATGIDISSAMVATFNASFAAGTSPKIAAQAHVGNLLTSSPSPTAFAGPDFHDFDIAAVGAGFHHFADPALAAKRLAQRLRPGGVLLVIDFCAHSHDQDHGHGHGHGQGHGHAGENGEEWSSFKAAHTVKTHGFTREAMWELFEGADDEAEGVKMEGFAWSEMDEEVEMRVPRKEGSEAGETERVMYRRVFLARAARAAV